MWRYSNGAVQTCQEFLVTFCRGMVRLPLMAESEEGAVAASALNAEASIWLLRSRRKLKLSRDQFADLLTERLGFTVSRPNYGHYERADRSIPAAVLLGAAGLAHIPIVLDEQSRRALIDELADEVEKRERRRAREE